MKIYCKKNVTGKKSVKASVSNLSASKVASFVNKSIKTLKTSDITCCRMILDNDLCLYVGYASGYDTDNGYAICAKIAERNDADWADYEYLNMPYAPDGDVWDTDMTFEDTISNYDAQWYVEQYEAIREALDEGTIEL